MRPTRCLSSRICNLSLKQIIAQWPNTYRGPIANGRIGVKLERMPIQVAVMRGALSICVRLNRTFVEHLNLSILIMIMAPVTGK